jgi:hypothetical protein
MPRQTRYATRVPTSFGEYSALCNVEHYDPPESSDSAVAPEDAGGLRGRLLDPGELLHYVSQRPRVVNDTRVSRQDGNQLRRLAQQLCCSEMNSI